MSVSAKTTAAKPATGRELRILIGISSCLLGREVRFDGGHKRDAYITETLGLCFDFVPVCPEVGIGLGVPREPIRLSGDPVAPRAVGVHDARLDVTDSLAAYGARMARELGGTCGISGYIFKSKSPSCGIAGVKVYGDRRTSPRSGRGIYARALMQAHPLLPAEEEDRLADHVRRDNFIERVYAYRRWQDMMQAGLSAARLIDFHTAHKLAIMAHGTEHYRRLGRIASDFAGGDLGLRAEQYLRAFMTALCHRATRKRHANVLLHLLGYLKRDLNGDDKAKLLEVIEAYRLGRVPLAVPATLLRHHFRRHPHAYVEKQVYLNPHPQEAALRGLGDPASAADAPAGC